MASNTNVETAAGLAVQITLRPSDADGDHWQHRIVDEPAHSRPGVADQIAVYIPASGFSGTDHFTYAARDASTDSNLATVTTDMSAPLSPLTCPTRAPALTVVGVSTSFQLNVTASSCTVHVSYQWDFADDTPHAFVAAPTHAYARPGSSIGKAKTSADGVECASTSTMTVQKSTPIHQYLTFVTHNTGKLGTLWRSDVVVTSLTDQNAALRILFNPGAGAITVTKELLAKNGSVVRCRRVAVPSRRRYAGSVLMTSDNPVSVVSRIYTPYGQGTVGQAMPAITSADAMEPEVDSFLPALPNTTDFRLHLGLLNISEITASVAIDLFDSLTSWEKGSS